MVEPDGSHGTDMPIGGADPQWARRGPMAVARHPVDRWCVVDGVNVAVTVHHPLVAPDVTAPAVVFCHGLGGGRDLYRPIGTHLASHGIVSIHPEFDDAFDRVQDGWGLRDVDVESWPSDPAARAAFHRMLFDPAQWRSRARRVGAVIDAIGSHDIPGLGSPPVLLAGHSFGAFTAQMLAGVHLSDPALGDEQFAHRAVGAAALLSPQGSGSRGLHPRSWDDLTIPLLVVTATNDFGPRGEGLPWRREPFDAAPARDKWLLVARDCDHGLGGIVSCRVAAGNDAVVTEIAGSIAALASLIGGNSGAADWLNRPRRPDLFVRADARAEA